MLDSEQVEKLRGLLHSSGWREVMKPSFIKRGQDLTRALILLPSERGEPMKSESDDMLRGRLRELEWVLAAFENEIVVHDHNRLLAERERQTNGEPVRNP